MNSVVKHMFRVRPAAREILVVTILGILTIGQQVHAASSVYNTTPEGVAIGGYDPVAYQIDHAPRLGDPDIILQWSGAEWHFTSEANRDMFERDPERYAPAYGGWCAMAMAGGSVVEVDFVRAWSTNNNRLYLNVDAGIKKRWQRGARRFIRMADKEWPDVQPAILEDRVTIARRDQFPEVYE